MRQAHSVGVRADARPLGSRTLDRGVGPVQKIYERRTAGKAVHLAVVGIDPIERAVGFDPRARRYANWIEAVELPVHRPRRDGGLPNSAAASASRRRGLSEGRRAHRCETRENQQGARLLHF